MQERFILGWGGYPFVGPPEQIVETFRQASEAGIDGVEIGLLDFAPTRWKALEALAGTLRAGASRARSSARRRSRRPR